MAWNQEKGGRSGRLFSAASRVLRDIGSPQPAAFCPGGFFARLFDAPGVGPGHFDPVGLGVCLTPLVSAPEIIWPGLACRRAGVTTSTAQTGLIAKCCNR
jgi:hypothetical protein